MRGALRTRGYQAITHTKYFAPVPKATGIFLFLLFERFVAAFFVQAEENGNGSN